jgi:hypothetical protein
MSRDSTLFASVMEEVETRLQSERLAGEDPAITADRQTARRGETPADSPLEAASPEALAAELLGPDLAAALERTQALVKALRDLIQHKLDLWFGPRGRRAERRPPLCEILAVPGGSSGPPSARLDRENLDPRVVAVFDAPLERLRVRTEVTREEYERTSFTAEGCVRTADGERFSFSFATEMERHSVERLERRLLIDPLVVHYGGTAAELAEEYFRFDLDADGAEEAVPRLADGSAFLACDVNGNGVIDDGSELFGAASGNGFAELAEHDADGNGWIDEGDPVFKRLGLWTVDELGQPSLRSLRDLELGALGLDHVESRFTLARGGEVRGQVQSTGVGLREAGSPVLVQQIDLATRPASLPEPGADPAAGDTQAPA